MTLLVEIQVATVSIVKDHCDKLAKHNLLQACVLNDPKNFLNELRQSGYKL